MSSTPRSRAEADIEAGRNLRWHFAHCVVDGASLQLSVRGKPVALEPKPLELLLHLLRHPGEVVTKEELQESVWPGRVLSESVLAKAMAKLRAGLGDEDQTIIKTVYGYGYRLEAPVRLEAVSTPPPPRLDLKAGDMPPSRPQWRLQEQLGTGGFGEAWLVEHAKTRERRVFKFAFDATSLTALKREITLFRLLRDIHGGERQDFVRLLDWNLDEPPCFIETEYVAGGSLEQWARTRGGLGTPPLSERLEIVARIADALAAAHSAGVLHKDLKPGNVLMDVAPDGSPRPKLCDFGSGRITDPERLGQLEITRLGFTEGSVAPENSGGTPAYLAPELIAGQPPTVRSDIYALGVLLYQMAVGDLLRTFAPGWESSVADRLLREDIAIAAAGDSAQRLGDAAELARRLRTLPERNAALLARERAAAEAVELRRSLEQDRLRRRWAMAAAVMLGIALAVTGGLLAEVRQARDEARARETEMQEIVSFQTRQWQQLRPADFASLALSHLRTQLRAQPELRSGELAELDRLLGRVDVADLGREVLRDAWLAPAAQALQAQAGSGPRLRIALAIAVAGTYLDQGFFTEAEQLFRTTAASAVQELGGDDELSFEARLGLARSLEDERRAADQRAVLEPLHTEAARRFAADHALRLRIQSQWALLLQQERKHAEAVAAHRAVLAVAEKRNATGPAVAQARLQLAKALAAQEQYGEAVTVAKAARQALLAQWGASHPQAVEALRLEAHARAQAGEAAAVVPLLREVHQTLFGSLGQRHPQTIAALRELASASSDAGDAQGAMTLGLQALEAAQGTFGHGHETSLGLRNEVAVYAEYLNDLPLARRHYDQGLRDALASLGAEHPRTIRFQANIANLMFQQGDASAALPIAEAALKAYERNVPPTNSFYVRHLANTASIYNRLGRNNNAEALLKKAIRLTDENPDAKPMTRVVTRMVLANVLTQQSEWPATVALLEETLPMAQKAFGPEHYNTIALQSMLGNALTGAGRSAEALPHLRQGFEKMKAQQGEQGADAAVAAWALVEGLLASGQADEARRLYLAEVEPANRWPEQALNGDLRIVLEQSRKRFSR